MLIKLKGHDDGRPVLIETSALVFAEELEDIYRNNTTYTGLALVIDGHRINIRVEESCAEILKKIDERETESGGLL